MHKRYVNHCTLELSVSPLSPILIKSGQEGADPSKPAMEFVQTFHQGGRSIYLPGSSLKGALRAHAERIVRTVGQANRPKDPSKLWASDPLDIDSLKYLDDIEETPDIYRLSSFTDQMFGNTSIASRIRIEDAYPVDVSQVKTEERNGVAIDRVFGSVAVGPFNFEVCTAGEFGFKIHLKNFSLEQLGLLALVLRDLNEGWFSLGFAKSRGLGMVTVNRKTATVSYPGCVIEQDKEGDKIVMLGQKQSWPANRLLGAGAFLDEKECQRYGFPSKDEEATPIHAEIMPLGIGVMLQWSGPQQIDNLFELAAEAFGRRLTGVAA